MEASLRHYVLTPDLQITRIEDTVVTDLLMGASPFDADIPIRHEWSPGILLVLGVTLALEDGMPRHVISSSLTPFITGPVGAGWAFECPPGAILPLAIDLIATRYPDLFPEGVKGLEDALELVPHEEEPILELTSFLLNNLADRHPLQSSVYLGLDFEEMMEFDVHTRDQDPLFDLESGQVLLDGRPMTQEDWENSPYVQRPPVAYPAIEQAAWLRTLEEAGLRTAPDTRERALR